MTALTEFVRNAAMSERKKKEMTQLEEQLLFFDDESELTEADLMEYRWLRWKYLLARIEYYRYAQLVDEYQLESLAREIKETSKK